MMKSASILFVLFSALSAFAQDMTCLDRLLPFNRYSGLHQISRDEWSDGKEIMDAESAKNAITFLVNSKLLCRSGEFVLKVAPVCTTILADLTQSQTCFAFSNLGFLVVSRDNGRNINIIFSKDKKFSDKN